MPRFDAMLGLLCDATHPALAQFPTDTFCDWQWTPLVDNVRSVNLSRTPKELVPIVAAIDDWNRNWRLGVIFECKVGPGRLLVSAIDLQGISPSAKQLASSLLAYMRSSAFRPIVGMTSSDVAALWAGLLKREVRGPAPTLPGSRPGRWEPETGKNGPGGKLDRPKRKNHLQV